MNNIGNHTEKITGIIQDILIAILIAIPFIFIGFSTALFVGAIVASILLMRRTIKSLNPGYINGYRILNKGNELTVLPRVEVFEISNSATFEILYKYVEVLKMMAIRPSILIIRLNRIWHIHSQDADILSNVITNLSIGKIKIYLSDVDINLERQLKTYNLLQKIGKDFVFCSIDDAIKYAEKSFGKH